MHHQKISIRYRRAGRTSGEVYRILKNFVWRQRSPNEDRRLHAVRRQVLHWHAINLGGQDDGVVNQVYGARAQLGLGRSVALNRRALGVNNREEKCLTNRHRAVASGVAHDYIRRWLRDREGPAQEVHWARLP